MAARFPASRKATASRPCRTGNSPQWRRTPSRVSCNQRRVTSPPPGNTSAIRSPKPPTRSTHPIHPVRPSWIRAAPDMQLNFQDQLELDPYHLFNLNTGLLYDTLGSHVLHQEHHGRKPATLIRPGTRRPRPPGLSRRPTPHVRHTQPRLLLRPVRHVAQVKRDQRTLVPLPYTRSILGLPSCPPRSCSGGI